MRESSSSQSAVLQAPSGASRGQNDYINHTKPLSVVFIVLEFALMMQKQWG